MKVRGHDAFLISGDSEVWNPEANLCDLKWIYIFQVVKYLLLPRRSAGAGPGLIFTYQFLFSSKVVAVLRCYFSGPDISCFVVGRQFSGSRSGFSLLATCVSRCLSKPCIVSCFDAYVYSVSVAENISSWMPVIPIFLSRAAIHLCSRKSLRKWLPLFLRILHVIIIIIILIEREDALFLFFCFFSGDFLLWTVSSLLFYSCSTFLLFKCQVRHLGEDRLLNKVHYLFQIFPVKIVWTLAP